MTAQITVHDSHPSAESALVDQGLGDFNAAAAPLHEVRPMSCFARSDSGQVLGGAVGRRWGRCCELQQLWVEPTARGKGLGAQLMRAFEAQAVRHECDTLYLETYSFQVPGFYAALGYTVTHEHAVYPHGIVKFMMVKRFAPRPGCDEP